MSDRTRSARPSPESAERARGFWHESFAWSGSAAPRIVPQVALFGLVSAVICSASGPEVAIPVGPHEVVGVILGLFLVFRTNAGYERWWEARRLWGGIVNQSRNLAVQALCYGPDDEAWRADVVRSTIAFAHACRRSLRGEGEVPEIATLLGTETACRVDRSAHAPTALARRIGLLLGRALDDGGMPGFAFQQAEGQRALLIDYLGGCERILKTPPAPAFSVEIRRFLVLFLMTLNFALLEEFDSRWLVPPFLMLVAYPILSVDLIGVELQDPFSTRRIGHLALDSICRTIESDLLSLLDDRDPPDQGTRPARPGDCNRLHEATKTPSPPGESCPERSSRHATLSIGTVEEPEGGRSATLPASPARIGS